MFYGRGQGDCHEYLRFPIWILHFSVCQGLAGNGTEIQGILEFVVVQVDSMVGLGLGDGVPHHCGLRDIVPHGNENLYVLVVIMRSRIHGLGPNVVTA